ncbi:MAG: DUF427 domain-containing protein [Yoonia sp.]|uniref:DUF427 domain-containing protein n=1 Tax=Rhodobacterales TaxID=204455 RepID=UPI001FF123BA|nr:DUF427 domain-containing protein [Loktanella sp. F6476L]MCK0119452.1 DUF427 domain-containing protein [Loktanella sp. F6476L]UWR00771.1 DUF427 domain-containing protein [Rhodobacteraceae bacterium S2214]
MAHQMTISPAEGTWVVRVAGAVLGETTSALMLTEGDYDPVIYFPRDSIAMAFLEPSDTTTVCPHKGTATYFAIEAKSGTLADAVWTYENPLDGAKQIAGYLAFQGDKVTIEQV